jgi:DNA-binding IscR family transcriptional regulator
MDSPHNDRERQRNLNIYIWLCRISSERNDAQRFILKQQELAERSHMTRKTARAALHILASLGIIRLRAGGKIRGGADVRRVPYEITLLELDGELPVTMTVADAEDDSKYLNGAPCGE